MEISSPNIDHNNGPDVFYNLKIDAQGIEKRYSNIVRPRFTAANRIVN